jgi:hypothetical protein
MGERLLQSVAARQDEIAAAIVMSNYLAIAGRVLEIAIGIMLALVLIKLSELCRRTRG